MRNTVDLSHASRLVNHGPTVINSAAHEGRRNLMAAAWSMPVEFTAPRIALVIDKSTFTRDLVKASGRLAINIPCRLQADMCFAVGSDVVAAKP
jgi:flavin reductase (DIM6/NTAB) family NADH-FMN oxidoreductase RutF